MAIKCFYHLEVSKTACFMCVVFDLLSKRYPKKTITATE
jgi:hypothetical protein